MSLGASAMRAAMRHLQEAMGRPIDGITILPADDLAEIEADITGPEDTPFHRGVFRVSLVLSDQYPDVPPLGYFRTKVFHPNVSAKGEICVSTLKKDWDPSLGLRHVLTVIRCLLIEPNPESALNEEAGMLLLEDYAAYVRKARMYTSVHAMPAGASADAGGAATTTEGGAVGGTAGSGSGGPLRNVAEPNAVPSAVSVAEKKAIDKKKAALKKL